jgi:two-component system NtrC family sensor kinase
MHKELDCLIERLNPGIAWIDADYRVISNNSEIGRLYGKLSADFAGHHCHDLCRGQKENCPDCPGQEAMSTGKPVFKERQKDLENGKKVRVRVHAFPTFAEDGSVKGFLKIVEDISSHERIETALEAMVAERTATLQRANQTLKTEIAALKNMEATLKHEQHERLQQHEELNQLFNMVELGKREWEAILDCIKEMVVLVDGEGRIRRCNKALAELTGKSYPELIGKDLRKVFKNCQLPLGDLFRQGGEVCHKLSGRWFLLNSYRLNRARNEGGAVITLYDYTSLKELTHKLEDSNQLLELKGSQLEAAYAALNATQIKILQQEKMASIGQLAAGVAHEINNPIGFISSNLRTLKKYFTKLSEFIGIQNKELQTAADRASLKTVSEAWAARKLDYISEDVWELISESLDGAERVRKIVQDLKTFSRVDEAEWIFANLVECLESTINIVWNEIKYKATLVRDFAELPPVQCYPHQLSQVFMNLLLNAAQAIDREGQIFLKAWQEEETVLFSVADTGSGIPEENLNQIFEPFFTTKEAGQGTGLGLGLSYEIVKKHQGEILVESEIGKGTTFTVRIPINAKGSQENRTGEGRSG